MSFFTSFLFIPFRVDINCFVMDDGSTEDTAYLISDYYARRARYFSLLNIIYSVTDEYVILSCYLLFTKSFYLIDRRNSTRTKSPQDPLPLLDATF